MGQLFLAITEEVTESTGRLSLYVVRKRNLSKRCDYAGWKPVSSMDGQLSYLLIQNRIMADYIMS